MFDSVCKLNVLEFELLINIVGLKLSVKYCFYRLKRELERRGGGGKKVKKRRQPENGEN